MPPHSAPAGVDDEGMPLSETTVPALRPPAHRVSPRAVYFWFTRALVGWLALIAVQVLSWVFDWPVPPWHAQLLGVTLVVALVHLAVMPLALPGASLGTDRRRGLHQDRLVD